jgi:anhydro-N-acetylmuramic acid kinase
MRVVGLMSGTSLDGIDAAVVRFEGDLGNLQWTVEAFITQPYTDAQREQIHFVLTRGGPAELCRLNADLGEWFAAAVGQVCEAAKLDTTQIDLVGSHGQTIWHEPPTRKKSGATLQLGCASIIAERTGIPVVSDFRTRDVAADGQGAPLVPWVDRLLFSHPEHARVLLNIGGIANLSWLPPRGRSEPILAFDTGPGNALINLAVEWATAGNESFDRNGKRATAGQVDGELLTELLAEPYFGEEPPKSTGRELFGRSFLDGVLRKRPDIAPNTLIATLTALTGHTIASAIHRWVVPRGVTEVVATGGGGRNPELMRRLTEALEPIPVLAGETLHVDPDAKEALAFAALAWAHVNGIPANVPEATGAKGPRVLGSFTPGSQDRTRIRTRIDG